MAINISVQYNGGFLPGVIFHTVVDPMLLPLRNPFKRHENMLSLQPMIPPNFSLDSIACIVLHNLTMSACNPTIARKTF